MTSPLAITGFAPATENGLPPLPASILPSLPSTATSVAKAGGGLVSSLTSQLFSSGSDNMERFVTGALGLLLIAGGIFLFKPVRDVVVKTTGYAAGAAV